MQELDHKEGWVLKNWCFRIVVMEKTLENPLDSKEIKPVNPKGNQSWIFIGRTDAEAEAPILWPPDAKSQCIRKDPDAGKDWRQEKRTTEDEMDGILDSMDMNLSKLREMVKEAWSAAVHRVGKSLARLSDWTTTNSDILAQFVERLFFPLLGCFDILVEKQVTKSEGLFLNSQFFLFFWLLYFFFNWRIFALQNFVVFCHTSRINHRYTHVPSLPNLLPSPPHSTLLRLSQSELSILFHQINMFNLVLIPNCLGYCSCVVTFGISKFESYNFVLFQDCFGYSGSLGFPYKF